MVGEDERQTDNEDEKEEAKGTFCGKGFVAREREREGREKQTERESLHIAKETCPKHTMQCSLDYQIILW